MSYNICNAARRRLLGTVKAFISGRRKTDRATKAAPVQRKRREDGARIEKLLKEWAGVPSNISGDFTMETLATAIGICRRTLADYFGKTIKKDFRLWKSELKIELSKKLLLKDDGLDIYEICDAIGFRNRACFHRHFKTLTGCTPLHWRRTGGHPEIK